MKNGYFITAIFRDGSTADYARGILADLLADADVCAGALPHTARLLKGRSVSGWNVASLTRKGSHSDARRLKSARVVAVYLFSPQRFRK